MSDRLNGSIGLVLGKQVILCVCSGSSSTCMTCHSGHVQGFLGAQSLTRPYCTHYQHTLACFLPVAVMHGSVYLMILVMAISDLLCCAILAAILAVTPILLSLHTTHMPSFTFILTDI